MKRIESLVFSLQFTIVAQTTKNNYIAIAASVLSVVFLLIYVVAFMQEKK